MPDLGSYLFNMDPGEPDLFTYLAGAIFLLALVMGLFVYLRRRQLFGAVPALARFVGGAGAYAAVIGGVGLGFTLLSYVRLPLLGSRFWLAGMLLGLVVWFGWFIYYSRVRLPALIERYRQATLREQYLPRPGAGRGSRNKKAAKKRR
ncbi:MAG: hypothetical protein ACYC4L_22375 [Chloroflexota bacterium]